jgi:acetyl-CoA carboxylase/biotin carboxylase 1
MATLANLAKDAINGVKAHTNGTVPILNGQASKEEVAAKHKLADHFIGGNRLTNAPPSAVKNFVQNHDGHTVITNVSRGDRGWESDWLTYLFRS